MSETKPFIPGFETEKDAIKAGKKFFEKADGTRGVYRFDFHIVPNAHGRWHFEEGPAPKNRVEDAASDAA